MKKTTADVRIASIPTEELFVDTYQRINIKMPKVLRIVNQFDPGILGIIKVSRRDGKYYVIDGQHRVLACKMMNVSTMKAEVIEGLTIEEEAEKFLKMNGANGEVTPLSAFDVFNAKVVAKQPIAVSVKDIVESHGFAIGYGNVMSVKKLMRLHDKYGALILDRAFKVIRKAWNGDKSALNSYVMSGVIEFVATYDGIPAYSDVALAKQLPKVSPKELIKLIKFDESTRILKVKEMNAILKVYNYELKKNRLDNIHFNAR